MRLQTHLLETAAGRRHGITLPVVDVPATPADIPGFFNSAVPSIADTEASPAAGGTGRTPEVARYSALGEALERYAGSLCPLDTQPLGEIEEPLLTLEDFSLFTDEQRAQIDFPYPEQYRESQFVDTYDLRTNQRIWVPAPLVTLDRRYMSMATSSGMAANPDVGFALLRGLQELIERDALMVTWMHQIKGRQIVLDPYYREAVESRGGSVFAIDATPAYSPHPVAIVLGNVPRRGRPRLSLGAACRETWVEAVEKAYLEWSQGITFVGDRLLRDPDRKFASPTEVRDFDHHAIYYSTNPDEWENLPILKGTVTKAPATVSAGSTWSELERLSAALHDSGIRTLYRDLTTRDLRQVGMTAVRVLSPDLVPVHHDHRFPYLGGTAADVAARYPWATDTSFPSRFPHPLG